MTIGRMLAKVFMVVSLGAGTGLLAGGGTFAGLGAQGNMSGGPFGHVGEIIGLGVGLLTSSLATSFMLWSSKPTELKPRGVDPHDFR